jgi:hypothetical protein
MRYDTSRKCYDHNNGNYNQIIVLIFLESVMTTITVIVLIFLESIMTTITVTATTTK